MTGRARWHRRLRIATLIVPSWLAWSVTFALRETSALLGIVAYSLGPLWALLACVLLLRTIEAMQRRGAILAELDVLTRSGVALAWLSAAAIAGAAWIGFASLAAVGLLGTGVFHVAVVYALIVLRGADPLRSARITRRFARETVKEGDAVAELVRFDGARIPVGFRLFAAGRIGPRWPTSRYVLDARESGAEVVLEGELGPALRGVHDAAPLDVWVEDAFGLCRSALVKVGAARLTVVPRLHDLAQPVYLRRAGVGPRAPRNAIRLPTEGLFNLREYQPGDDPRRIHWVRSVAAGQLIVRLPDELPPDRPHVRLVLDTFFPEAFTLACDTPAEQLDALVGVWLGVAWGLVRCGVGVTLVAAVVQEGRPLVRQVELGLREPDAALRLGAEIAWQGALRVDALLTDDVTFIVSQRVNVTPPETVDVRWILVPPRTPDPVWALPSATRFPHPIGSSENRWSHRQATIDALAQRRADHVRAILAMRTHLAAPPAGRSFIAALEGGAIRLEPIR